MAGRKVVRNGGKKSAKTLRFPANSYLFVLRASCSTMTTILLFSLPLELSFLHLLLRCLSLSSHCPPHMAKITTAVMSPPDSESNSANLVVDIVTAVSTHAVVLIKYIHKNAWTIVFLLAGGYFCFYQCEFILCMCVKRTRLSFVAIDS